MSPRALRLNTEQAKDPERIRRNAAKDAAGFNYRGSIQNLAGVLELKIDDTLMRATDGTISVRPSKTDAAKVKIASIRDLQGLPILQEAKGINPIVDVTDPGATPVLLDIQVLAQETNVALAILRDTISSLAAKTNELVKDRS